MAYLSSLSICVNMCSSVARFPPRSCVSGAPLVVEQVLARLEDAIATVLAGVRGLGGLGLEVVEVGLAEGAADDVEVEGDVGRQGGVEGVEQGAAELLAGRAGEAAPPPDGPEGVQAGVASVLADVLEPGAELGRLAQRLLDAGLGPGG